MRACPKVVQNSAPATPCNLLVVMQFPTELHQCHRRGRLVDDPYARMWASRDPLAALGSTEVAAIVVGVGAARSGVSAALREYGLSDEEQFVLWTSVSAICFGSQDTTMSVQGQMIAALDRMARISTVAPQYVESAARPNR